MDSLEASIERLNVEVAPMRDALASAVRKLAMESGLSLADQSSVLQSVAYECARLWLGDNSRTVYMRCEENA